MKKLAQDIPLSKLISDYLELNSCYKVAKRNNTSATAVKRLLKEARVLRTQSEAASIRNKENTGIYEKLHTPEVAKKISSSRKGQPSAFKGKKHTEENKRKIGERSKQMTGERNPNYKDGKYIRRPRDFKIHEFAPVRNRTFHRDNFTCHYCKKVGGHLHAHHRLPYWVKPEAFLDIDNLVTVCSKCHFQKAHNGSWHRFNKNLVSDALLIKYSLNRERLNDLTPD
ncbi:MAG: NUMOD3 domain-containing DNA-binding protein [Bacteroidota bacterium]|nr:NUMOD3 domain-containing DNA-binding protein [Bacteroidota bacterium]